MLSVINGECYYAEYYYADCHKRSPYAECIIQCRYAECHYPECHSANFSGKSNIYVLVRISPCKGRFLASPHRHGLS